MDLNGVENIDFNALGGADTITVNDLTGTDVNQVAIDLGDATGAGDGPPTPSSLNATNGDDVITITNNNGVVTVTGLGDDVTISDFDANDPRHQRPRRRRRHPCVRAHGHAAHRQWRRWRRRPDRQRRQRHPDRRPATTSCSAAAGKTCSTADRATTSSSTAPSADCRRARLLGQFMASSFVSAGGGQGATPITDPPGASSRCWLSSTREHRRPGEC